MDHIASELPRSLFRDILSLLNAIAVSKKEVSRIRQKLHAQTVFIGKWIDEGTRDLQMLHENLLGAGTLVRNGDTFGILTAGHVARELKRGGGVLMTVGQSLNPMKSGRQPCRFMSLQGWIGCAEGTQKIHGNSSTSKEAQLAEPDLAWIRISEPDARKLGPEGFAGGIFHDWQKSERTRPKEICEQRRGKYGLWMCGWARETSERLLEVGRPGGCLMARQVIRERPAPVLEDGWDRFDYTMRLDDRPREGYSDWGDAGRNRDVRARLDADPSRWGGISGSGIWHAHRQEEQDDVPHQCSLVGVVYAEHPPPADGLPVTKLRAHGIGSINRVLGCE